jgi:hypothetical protein
MADEKKDKLVEVENMEITALDDQELESVAGGYTEMNTVQSCSCCVSGANRPSV